MYVCIFDTVGVLSFGFITIINALHKSSHWSLYTKISCLHMYEDVESVS